MRLLLGIGLVCAALYSPANAALELGDSIYLLPPAGQRAIVDDGISAATRCMVETMLADSRLAAKGTDNLTEVLTDAAISCSRFLKAMIYAYDAVYGEGAGMKFLDEKFLEHFVRHPPSRPTAGAAP